MFIKKAVCLKLALLSFIPLLAPTDPASAGLFSKGSVHCKNVHMTINNNTGKRIKIVDLHYYDPARQRWYSEVIKNEQVPNGKPWTATRRLEQVNKKKTRLSVRYRVEEGANEWSGTIDQWAPSRFVCDAGDSYEFSVTQITPGKYEQDWKY
ncbi:MAG: hypothetical protein AAGB01_03810 [Cyanobacteria bacterium P01_F01_bin.42]